MFQKKKHASRCLHVLASTACALMLQVAHAQPSDAANADTAAPAVSAECARMQADVNADLHAEVKAGCQPTEAQIGKLMDNPVGNLIMAPLQEDFTLVKIPDMPGFKAASRTQFIPTFPTSLNENWTLINRVSFPIVSYPVNKHVGGLIGDTPAQAATDWRTQDIINDPFHRTTGLGDITYVGLVAPSQTTKFSNGGEFVWGVGPTVMLPTASQAVLGTGKYSAGPTFVLAYLGPKWLTGVFPQHWWSFASSKKDRAPVNMTNIQYFIYRSLDDAGKWRVGMSPNISINWNAKGGGNKVDLPIGFGLGYTTKWGKLPVRVGFEAQYSVIAPASMAGARWNYRFVIIPVIPKFLL